MTHTRHPTIATPSHPVPPAAILTSRRSPSMPEIPAGGTGETSDPRVPLALPVSMRFHSFRRGRGRQNNIQSRAVTGFGASFPQMHWQSQLHPARPRVSEHEAAQP